MTKALTICQPYASLILRGDKRVENRTWHTKHRGWLYIHAGKSRAWFGKDQDLINMFGRMPPFGAVIGIAKLVDCVAYNNTSFDKYPWMKTDVHSLGPWCWVLESVCAIGPWPWKGAQGLFDIDDDQLDVAANMFLMFKEQK